MSLYPNHGHQRAVSAGDWLPPRPPTLPPRGDGDERGRSSGKVALNKKRQSAQPAALGPPPPQLARPQSASRLHPQPYPNAMRSSSQPPVGPRVDTRVVSAPSPAIPQPAAVSSNDTSQKLQRKSWLPGLGNRKGIPPRAWISGHEGKVAYNIQPLVEGHPVSELWDDSADALVYLFPRSSGKGPSFRVQSKLFISSSVLAKRAFGEVYSRRKPVPKDAARNSYEHNNSVPSLPSIGQGGAFPSTPPMTPKASAADYQSTSPTSSRGTRATEDSFDDAPREVHLYMPSPISPEAERANTVNDADLEVLISMRNLFAFLQGQSLVATDKRPNLFHIFMAISHALETFDFTNSDRTTFGEVAAKSFDAYVDELGLADVRPSREKTIESLVLAERMRSSVLYNEAFVHAVGRYDDLLTLSKNNDAVANKFHLVSATTRSRLERASIDLAHREKSVKLRLAEFEFPSLFAGIMASKTAEERKLIQFSTWKESFLAMRRHVISFYKSKFGAWPPRAQSKKNDFETSGLNRVLLKVLYRDFADMYDLYVDRHSLTTRSSDPNVTPISPTTRRLSQSDSPEEAAVRVLRRIFDEYDRSSPPVQPPVPYDVPLLPSPAVLQRVKQPNNKPLSPADMQRLRHKKLNEEDSITIVTATTNPDTAAKVRSSSFLDALRAFERREAKGKTPAQILDLRAGMWMFMYVVLQALPMLVVDAPGLHFRDGVEYFLCIPPRSGVPWAANAAAAEGASAARGKMAWYGVAGGHGVVNLPSDLIEHGVEGVYRRSHCWVVAANDWGASASASASGTASRVPSARPSFEQQLQQQHKEHLLLLNQPSLSSLPPPPPLLADDPYSSNALTGSPRSLPTSRDPSPAPRRQSARDSVLALGLEQLPLPAGVAPVSSYPGAGGGAGSRPSSRPASRVSSAQNLAAMNAPLPPGVAGSAAGSGAVGVSAGTPTPGQGYERQGSVPVPAPAPATTFDDILSNLERETADNKGKKKAGKK